MYTIELSKKELKKIKQLINKEKRVKVYRRLQAVEMIAAGHAYQTVAAAIGVGADTVTDWIQLYAKSGLTELCTLHFTGKRTSPLDAYVDQIKQDITDNTIATLAALQAWIKDKYSLEMEQSWLWRCCKKNSIYLTKRPA
jgi:transposase